MERQGRESDARQLAGQERFYREAGATYAELAASVDRSLKDSLTESARLAGETMQPVAAATMAAIARETTALQERVADAVAAQHRPATRPRLRTSAGPLNSHFLVLQALRQLRDVSPGYLEQFISYADALLWLEQLDGGGSPARKNAVRAEPGKKRKSSRRKAG